MKDDQFERPSSATNLALRLADQLDRSTLQLQELQARRVVAQENFVRLVIALSGVISIWMGLDQGRLVSEVLQNVKSMPVIVLGVFYILTAAFYRDFWAVFVSRLLRRRRVTFEGILVRNIESLLQLSIELRDRGGLAPYVQVQLDLSVSKAQETLYQSRYSRRPYSGMR